MKVNNISEDREDYIDFVVEGLEKYEKAQRHIEKIDVYRSSINVTYKENHENITELLQIHDHIMDHGLDSFISRAAMNDGNRISYKLED